MSNTPDLEAEFPIKETLSNTEITLRLMTPKDEQGVLQFANTLPESDVIYLRLDITQPDVVSEWVKNIRYGRTMTILVIEDDKIVGYGSLHHNQTYWTRHIGELRLLVSAKLRGLGIGRILVAKLRDIARKMNLERLIVQIPHGQPRVRKMFEEQHFEPEAILTEWLRDRKGNLHDLIIMSKNIVR